MQIYKDGIAASGGNTILINQYFAIADGEILIYSWLSCVIRSLS